VPSLHLLLLDDLPIDADPSPRKLSKRAQAKLAAIIAERFDDGADFQATPGRHPGVRGNTKTGWTIGGTTTLRIFRTEQPGVIAYWSKHVPVER
jgi:hypothetical protein